MMHNVKCKGACCANMSSESVILLFIISINDSLLMSEQHLLLYAALDGDITVIKLTIYQLNNKQQTSTN